MTDVVKKVYDTEDDHHRIFLVVVDDTEEMRVALRFACMRAKSTGGRVALFRDIEPSDYHHWASISELMQQEAREAAEDRLNELAQEVVELSGQIPAIYVRAGPIRQELIELINEEPTISVLVLAASASNDGPGPLVSHLIGKGTNSCRIPITIVPGNLSAAQIDALA
ncbi:MAG: universal stress protein [Rhodospirillaceae bacterium]|nr:universal stress protein [Rhodospirillaceae bacterium]|tara:strand:+ start:671 stop:1174 length:504 start_codon:yes stop_codon:yes gene_type:complete